MTQGTKKTNNVVSVPKLSLSNITLQASVDEGRASPVKKNTHLNDKSSVRTLEGLMQLNATIEKDKQDYIDYFDDAQKKLDTEFVKLS